MVYLDLLGEQVRDEGGEWGEERCEEDAHIAHVDGDVEVLQRVVDRCWRHHQTRVDGAWCY